MPDTMKKITELAKVDRGLMKASLFRPIPPRRQPGKRKPPPLELEITYLNRILKIVSPYTLGANDLSIMLVVVALAGIQKLKVRARDSEQCRRDIIDGLGSTGEYVDADHLQVKTSIRELCNEAGLKINGGAYKRIAASLERLGCVSFIDRGQVGAKTRSIMVGERLLAARMGEASRQIVFTLNARFAWAILGGHYMPIALEESRGLSEMAKLLHFRLSIVFREGAKEKEVATDELGEWIYGEVANSNRERSRRREEIKRGMISVNGIRGWSAIESKVRPLHYQITRPKRASRSAPATEPDLLPA
jgi:hypothetical protein